MLPIVRKDSNTNTKPLSMLHHRSINCHNINCCFWKAIDNAIFRMNQNAVILRLYRTASLLQNPYTGRMRQEHNRSSDIFREIHGSFSTHIARIPRSNSVKLTLRMLVPLYFQILHFANMAATSSSVAKPLASDNLISSSNYSSVKRQGISSSLSNSKQRCSFSSSTAVSRDSIILFFNPWRLGVLYATNGSDASVLMMYLYSNVLTQRTGFYS